MKPYFVKQHYAIKHLYQVYNRNVNKDDIVYSLVGEQHKGVVIEVWSSEHVEILWENKTESSMVPQTLIGKKANVFTNFDAELSDGQELFEHTYNIIVEEKVNRQINNDLNLKTHHVGYIKEVSGKYILCEKNSDMSHSIDHLMRPSGPLLTPSVLIEDKRISKSKFELKNICFYTYAPEILFDRLDDGSVDNLRVHLK